jgi:uncharacterized protein YqfA (UPF0365 family)
MGDLGLVAGVGLIVGVIVLFAIIFHFVPLGLYISAWAANARVSILGMVGMRLRKVPPHAVVVPRIAAVKADLDIPVDRLEAHYLAGGHVENVVNALISAAKARIPLDFDRAASIDLAGRNVLDAVQMSVNPKVITSPKIGGVAKDGIQVLVISRVTVRTNLDRLVGGAGEETILARVGEGIVSTIGSATSYAEVLENPDSISKNVLGKGLDAGTAFEILSIDIADVDVGQNVGAKLQEEQAQADKVVAQARAEARRAMAVAAEQENKARVQEMRARVVEAEAQVPLAMAEAFRSGNLGVMDYLRMRNVESDTRMRDSLSRLDEAPDATTGGEDPGPERRS